VDLDQKGNTKGYEEYETIGSNWVHLRFVLLAALWNFVILKNKDGRSILRVQNTL
jgi:hypothetical protein